MKQKMIFKTLFVLVLLTGLQFQVYSQTENEPDKKPAVVFTANKAKPPSDAIVLFDKGSLDHFVSVNDNEPAQWKVRGNHFTVVPGTGNIHTIEQFGDIQLHIEFRIPKDAEKFDGQKSGNSGIYIMGKYEIQVLNSYEKTTEFNRQAGSVYNQYAPLVNASLKPGQWQTYDIVFKAPEFDENGNQINPPYITVFHNGVLIQNNVEIMGPTVAYNENLPDNAEQGPLMLQDHDNKVSFRNIWIRKL
jgi:hypothetical protein